MNNPKFSSEDRSIRRARDKAKRKTAIRLLGKEKTDLRTFKNLVRIFDFIGRRQEFTGPEIVKNLRMASSIVYDLLRVLLKAKTIRKADEKKSAGRGKTDIFTLTTTGKIVAAFVTDNMILLESALKNIMEEEPNPLKHFAIQAFLANYSTNVMKNVLESSIRRAETLDAGINIDGLVTELIQNTFILSSQLNRDSKKEMEKIFWKNAELTEKSEHRDFLFLYFKMQMESFFLQSLEKEKLAIYVESLKEDPQMFHIPCENVKCTNVIKTDTFLNVNIPQYCKACEKKLEE